MAQTDLQWQNYTPKQQDRFIVSMDGLDAFTIRTVGRPKLTNAEIEIPYMNNTRYIKGKSTWEPIDFTTHDPISPAASKKFMEWALLHHDSATGVDGYHSEYSKNVTLKSLSGLGTVVEEWTLHEAWLTSVDFGGWDHTSADPVEITATLRYNWAELTTVAAG